MAQHIQSHLPMIMKLYAEQTPHIIIGWQAEPDPLGNFGDLKRRIVIAQNHVSEELEKRIPELGPDLIGIVAKAYAWHTNNLLAWTSSMIKSQPSPYR
jgi:hypothetical protein